MCQGCAVRRAVNEAQHSPSSIDTRDGCTCSPKPVSFALEHSRGVPGARRLRSAVSSVLIARQETLLEIEVTSLCLCVEGCV